MNFILVASNQLLSKYTYYKETVYNYKNYWLIPINANIQRKNKSRLIDKFNVNILIYSTEMRNTFYSIF